MYLKAIEALGFKSFADKTAVHFNKDITAIVGPNGSGKSNITDAVRWVLGEQSTRYLRASTMQDVIFAGTQKRHAMNMAQVSLIFDNTDSSLPIDFGEVEITRRIYRSGEGEYFINKKSCRLKDIYNLFMDTGVGRGSLFVIGQNKVDEILNGRADEKRVLIEDLAGIVRYKQRKNESLQRLEKIRENLLRISDIKIELENNMLGLQAEAQKTKEYNNLFAKYRRVNLVLLAYRHGQYLKQLEQASIKVAECSALQEEQKQQLSSLELQQTRNNQDVEDVQQEYVRANNDITDLVAKREQTVGTINLLQDKAAQLSQRSEELLAEQEQLRTVCSQLSQTQIVVLRDQQATQQAQEAHWRQEHQQLKTEYGLIAAEHELVAGEHAALQDKVNINLSAYMDNKNKAVYLEREIEQVQLRTENGRTALLEYADKIERTAAQLAATELEIQNIQAHNAELMAAAETLQSERRNIEQAAAAKNEEIDAFDKKLSKLNNENIVLERLRASYQGFGTGIKNVLTARQPWRSGIIGAVAEVITVPQQYITAVETALGGSAQHIITEDEPTAKQAVSYLKQGRLGRATFLPRTAIRGGAGVESALLREPGVLGTGEMLVGIREGLEQILKFLLGRILIVDHIDHALTIARKYGYKYRMVTLDGEMLNVGGSLTGGVNDKAQPGFLAREEEIKRNKETIEKMQNDRYELSEVYNGYEHDLKQLAGRLATQKETVVRNDLSLVRLKSQTQYLRETLEKEQRQSALMQQEVDNYSTQAEKLSEQLVQINRLVVELQADKDAHSSEIQALFQKVRSLQDQKEAQNNLVNEAYHQLSALTQALGYTGEKLAAAQDSLEQTTKKVQELGAQLTANKIGQSQLQEELQSVQTGLEKLNHERQVLNELLVSVTKKREGILSTQREIQGALKEQNNIQAANGRALSKAQSQETERRLQLNNIVEALRERFEATLEEALAVYGAETDIKQSQADAERLKDEIQALGLINPKAVEDYEQAMEKVEFLGKQYNDLCVAKEDLDKIIEEINKAMSERFKEAFVELNKHFAATYADLFGGGQASLKMLDENDWLNSGVEIFVQPQGKKVLSLNALSGGERSLTVIALLFAILSMKKTAFCVLDEIDAPLDEANIHRFKQFLLKYGVQTQFIMVTHRKPSMQIANTLYGVTMQEAGVSKVLSVHIKDLERMT